LVIGSIFLYRKYRKKHKITSNNLPLRESRHYDANVMQVPGSTNYLSPQERPLSTQIIIPNNGYDINAMPIRPGSVGVYQN